MKITPPFYNIWNIAIWNSTILSNSNILITTFLNNLVFVFLQEIYFVINVELIHATLGNHLSLYCVNINYCHQKHRFLECSRAWTCKMTACENTEGRKTFFFCRSWFSKPFEGVDVDQYPMNCLKCFLDVLIIRIGGVIC